MRLWVIGKRLTVQQDIVRLCVIGRRLHSETEGHGVRPARQQRLPGVGG